ncbi:putative small nuclear ribonucleoprotein G [Morella rubra]|uniref:Small nuclear ribonucleoprotein G n=1 Tax=Morella rubra TaxID=262757 RepID=A0A6A1VQY1_9ROSI|nr:putative small nuclear ribonucleoprotein G [Morella rubra]
MSRSGQPPDLKKYMDKKLQSMLAHVIGYLCEQNADIDERGKNSTYVLACVAVKLNANRMVVGTLRGFDQFMNLVVDNTVEVNGNEKNDIGMVVLRGNSVVTVEALEPVNRT